MNSKNFLIDTIERLSAAKEIDETWHEIVALSQEAGAKYVSIGQFSTAGYWPTWSRVSIEEELVEEFLAKGYQDVDPVLLARSRGKLPSHSHVTIPQMIGHVCTSERERECAKFDMTCGVTDFISFRYSGPSGQMEQLITLFGGVSNARELRSTGDATLATFAGILAAHATPPTPESPDGSAWNHYDFLSVRERDVLTYLACGLNNDQIAFRLGISEVTVRMHTRGARKKMGASTREQALALALARGLISP